MNLIREDLIYTDKIANRFTTKEKTGYKNFSQHFNENCTGYTIDPSTQRVHPSPETRTVNFDVLLSVLKSTDAA